MKKLLVSLLILIGTLTMSAESIGHIERQGGWYYIYNLEGKKTKTFGTSSGELVGYSSEIYILRSGSWYYIYNADARKETTLSVSSVGEILNVAGDTFTSKCGSWIYTWNRKGRKIATRAAR